MDHQDEIEEQCTRAVAIPDDAVGIVLSIDRVSLPMEHPCKRPVGRPKTNAAKRAIARVFEMAYYATIRWQDSQGKNLSTIRYSRMAHESIDDLCDGPRDDCKAVLGKRSELVVSVVWDGTQEFGNSADRAFSRENIDVSINALVDLWHVLEKAGRSMVARWGQERGSRELASWRMCLLNDSSAWKNLLDQIVR